MGGGGDNSVCFSLEGGITGLLVCFFFITGGAKGFKL